MIITRSPLRVTLGGGGTDLPSYYQQHGGFLIAAAIDKYVYITVHETFVEDLIVKYSSQERVREAGEVKHPIFREALKLVNLDGRGLEVASMADVPAGTGLGSSGTGVEVENYSGLNFFRLQNRILVKPDIEGICLAINADFHGALRSKKTVITVSSILGRSENPSGDSHGSQERRDYCVRVEDRTNH